jgi:HEAT repeat protein
MSVSAPWRALPPNPPTAGEPSDFALAKESDLPELLAAARSGADAEARAAAIERLTFLRDKRALRPLLYILGRKSEENRVRARAAEGVGCLLAIVRDDRRSYRNGLAALKAGLQDPDPEIRFWSVYGLQAARAREALPALRRLTRDRAAVSGLGTVGRAARHALRQFESECVALLDAVRREAVLKAFLRGTSFADASGPFAERPLSARPPLS